MAGEQLTFSTDVDDWCREVEARLLIVFRMSAQDVIEEMQKVGPSVASTKAAIAAGGMGPIAAAGEGGHMPVDLGFLRASLRVTSGKPMAMDIPATGQVTEYDPGNVTLAILGADLADVLYASYTAKYAARVNYGYTGTDSAGRTYNQRGYQFVGLAAQQWPQIVQRNVARAKAAGI